jgi:polysaccharide export outer membrane protein
MASNFLFYFNISRFKSSFLILTALGLYLIPEIAPCQAQQKPIASASTASPAAASTATGQTPVIPVETNYTLGAGDRIKVSMYKIPDLSGEFLVLVDGTIGFPIIGNLNVSGMTLNQLTAVLKSKYSEYVKRPVISVGLVSPRPLTIAIGGEVGIPGSYTLIPDKDQKAVKLTEIIQKAGGTTASADISQVRVIRIIQGQPKELNLNLWQLTQKGDQSQNIALRDGDSIIIPTKKQIDLAEVRELGDLNFGLQPAQEINFAIVGEVYRPGAYKVNPDRSSGANDETKQQPPRLSRAIQLAGGIKPLADIRQISIQRLTRSGIPQTIEVNLMNLLQSGDLKEDIILQNGDSITIPTATDINPKESESVAAASFSPATIRINVVGEVNKPGTVEVPPNTPLNQAILAAGGFNKRRADEGIVQLIRLNPNGTVAKRDVQIDFGKGINEETNPILRNNDVVVINRDGITETTDSLTTILSPLGAITGIFSVYYSVFK